MSYRWSRTRAARAARLLLGAVLPATVGGCMVGPDYHRPAAIVSTQFKELQPAAGWQRAMPAMTELDRGSWWRIYDDPVLDELEARVSVSNQNVKVSEANFRSARALIDAARASLFPTLSGAPSISRNSSGIGSNVSGGSGQFGGSQFGGGSFTSTTYQIQGTASWDLDVWGRIRRQVESDVAAAQASAADLANATLSYQATLAQDYFDLRYEDQLQDLLDSTIASYERSLRITQNQYDAGLATTTPIALLQARTQLEQTRAQAINVGVLRTQYEHALAVLTGRPPAGLALGPAPLTRFVPAIPLLLPATLLQRRPDIASAERAMEEQNALIGVQIAAFFPDISLSAAYGYSGNPIGSLIQVANRTWSLGASATEILFEGGLRSAQIDEARAQYDAAIATYRQTVLTALQGVEDDLSALRILAQEADAQAKAVALAEEAVTVALNEYRAGTTDYTTVVTSQVTALNDEQTALSIQQQRMFDSVSLIQQLGGGWSDADLPSKNSLQTNNPLIPSFLEKGRDR